MRNRGLRPGTAWAVGLVLLVAIGCSRREELEPDPGVSPFYEGPAAGARAPAGSPVAGLVNDRAGAGSPASEEPLRPEDVERQLRIAIRAAEKGDTARAIAMLDRILALEPANREALFGRASIAMDQGQRAASPEERAAAMEKAGTVVRALRRTYERSNKQELDLFARVLNEELRRNTAQGRLDRAVALLQELRDAGFDPFDRVEHDEELVKLRSSPGYQALVKGVDEANLAEARGRVKDRVARPLDFAFDFNVKDLDGKPLSLDQFKGKVVLVDIWGTWCKPCREALPALAQLYHKHRRRGLEVIGLDYEQNAPDPETARQYVKRFVQQSGIPYRIGMGDDAVLRKIPNFFAYPTTLLVDRAGKVRMLVTENAEGVMSALDDAIEVLLAEPAAKAADTKGAAEPPADTKGSAKAAPPTADAKGAAMPK